jgi:hypothetical protein
MKQFGRRHQIVKIPDPVPGHKIELRVVEHLTVNAGNLLNRLSVPGVLIALKSKVAHSGNSESEVRSDG